MKVALTTITAIVFSGFCGHVVTAQEFDLPVISLQEHLKALRADEKKGGYLLCGEDQPKEHRYESCAAQDHLYEKRCYAISNSDMERNWSYSMMCDSLDRLQKAHHPIVSYFNENSPNWWKSLPASIIWHPGATNLAGDVDPVLLKRQDAIQRLLVNKSLGDLEIIHAGSGEITWVLDKWGHEEKNDSQDESEDDSDYYRDLFSLNTAVLVDLDDDGVAELMLHGDRFPDFRGFSGSMERMFASFTLVLKKASSDDSVREMDW